MRPLWSAHAGPAALLAILIAGLNGDQGMARMVMESIEGYLSGNHDLLPRVV